MTEGDYTSSQMPLIEYTWSYKYYAATTSLGIESLNNRMRGDDILVVRLLVSRVVGALG